VRLGLVIYGALETVSGGYLYDRQLVAHLRQAGDEVTVLSIAWRDYGRHLLDNVAGGLRRQLRAGGWDVLLQDELNHPSLFALNHWLRQRGVCPIVSIVHHLRCSEARPAWQNAVYRLVERAYLRSVDGFIFNSQTTRRAVADILGPSALSLNRPYQVAYPAADHLGPPLEPAQIDARLAQPGPLRVLFIGNIIPRKGLHILLEALARLAGDWQLSVVGGLAIDPAYTRLIRAQVERLGLAKRVALLGRLDDAELRGHLESHHLLAVPSFYEGFGIVYLEAMARGLPVFATTAGAAAEIVADGVEGRLVQPGDAGALAAALQPLLADREKLRRMSQAARARCGRQPSWAESMAHARTFLLEQAAATLGPRV
jgi:glycosyltransferase involved in cell wall biosynthesis